MTLMMIELNFQYIFLDDDNDSDAHSEESDWIRF